MGPNSRGTYRGSGSIRSESTKAIRSPDAAATPRQRASPLPGTGGSPGTASSRLITVESGFWQLDRRFRAGDPGPGLLPGDSAPVLTGAEDVEALRTEGGGFPVLATITRPGGIGELYVGEIDGPRIRIATDAVVRSQGAKETTAATRMLGLVDGDLFWAWDMAAGGRPLGTHASAELKRQS